MRELRTLGEEREKKKKANAKKAERTTTANLPPCSDDLWADQQQPEVNFGATAPLRAASRAVPISALTGAGFHGVICLEARREARGGFEVKKSVLSPKEMFFVLNMTSSENAASPAD